MLAVNTSFPSLYICLISLWVYWSIPIIIMLNSNGIFNKLSFGFWFEVVWMVVFVSSLFAIVRYFISSTFSSISKLLVISSFSIILQCDFLFWFFLFILIPIKFHSFGFSILVVSPFNVVLPDVRYASLPSSVTYKFAIDLFVKLPWESTIFFPNIMIFSCPTIVWLVGNIHNNIVLSLINSLLKSLFALLTFAVSKS